MAILGAGNEFHAEAKSDACRFLLIAGLRLDEPVARAGPFVMNTQAELKQAISDYQSGRF
jgi:redox-sensitive bicupin YhaK (pirin superfamily)